LEWRGKTPPLGEAERIEVDLWGKLVDGEKSLVWKVVKTRTGH